MSDRCAARDSVSAPWRQLLAMAIATMTAILVGCGSSTASTSPRTSPQGSTAATTGPSPSGGPTGVSAEPGAARTFPPSQTAIEPGTYRWDGFERTISVDLGPGWSLGHDKPTFFDLFRGSDFPAITFARFSDVYLDRTAPARAGDAASVARTLAGRSDMTVTNASTVELGGLSGRQFDLTTAEPQTPLFFGSSGDFKLDPEFKTRYRILDVPSVGILVIGIHTRDGRFDDGVALGDPVVATLKVGP